MSSKLPRRYLVTILNTFAGFIFIGLRTTFALVMTHISRTNSSISDDNIFPNCTAEGGGSDFQVLWSGEEISLLHTAYFTAVFVAQIPSGLLAMRFSPRWLLLIQLGGTGVIFLTLPVIVQYRYELLMAVRVIQGFLEGSIITSLYSLMAVWCLDSEKSRLMGIFNLGIYTSPALSMVISSAISCYVRWSAPLYMSGGVSIICAALYVSILYDHPQDDPNLSDHERHLLLEQQSKEQRESTISIKDIPWRGILTSLPVYASITAAFCNTWKFGLMLTEQQEFYKDVYGINTATIGLLTAIPQLLMGFASLSSGFIFDHIILKEWLSRTNTRKLAHGIGFGLEAFCFLGIYFVDSPGWYLVFSLLCFGVGISGISASGFDVNRLELAPRFSPVIIALSKMGCIGSTVSTAIAGSIAGDSQASKDWKLVFLITAVVHIVGVIFFLMFASAEVQPWAKSEDMSPITDEANGTAINTNQEDQQTVCS